MATYKSIMKLIDPFTDPTLDDTKFSNFGFYGQTPKVRPFIGKPLSS